MYPAAGRCGGDTALGSPVPLPRPWVPFSSLQRHWVGPVRAAAWPAFPSPAAEGPVVIPSGEPSPPEGRDEPGAGGRFR